MARGTPVPITPSVLAWAIEQSGYSRHDVADKLGGVSGSLDKWLEGTERPGITALKTLARILRRPPATFLLPTPPPVEPRRVAFRGPIGEERKAPLPEELRRVREVSRIQEVIDWILDELGEAPATKFPTVKVGDDVDAAARAVRDVLGISVEDQLAWKDDSEALKSWREAVEASGILVFLLPMGAKTVRGFSLSHRNASAIALNSHWNQPARIYSLFHELGHLLTGTDSVCVQTTKKLLPATNVERWCEEFAAALLMPEPAVKRVLREGGFDPVGAIYDLAAPRLLTRRLHVSLRAATIRVIDEGLAEPKLYATIPDASDTKSGGGGGKGRFKAKKRYDEYGRRTAAVMLRGVDMEILPPTEAMRYLDVSYSDLEELQKLIG